MGPLSCVFVHICCHDLCPKSDCILVTTCNLKPTRYKVTSIKDTQVPVVNDNTLILGCFHASPSSPRHTLGKIMGKIPMGRFREKYNIFSRFFPVYGWLAVWLAMWLVLYTHRFTVLVWNICVRQFPPLNINIFQRFY